MLKQTSGIASFKEILESFLVRIFKAVTLRLRLHEQFQSFKIIIQRSLLVHRKTAF